MQGSVPVQRQVTGCQPLLAAPQVVGVVSGQAVHRAIEADFRGRVGGARRVQIPGASASPQRTQGICGADESEISSQVLSGGAGLPDLARVTSPGGILQVAEIKPAAITCLVDGEDQLKRYVDQGNADDAAQARWRMTQGVRVVTPMPPSAYPAPILAMGSLQVRTAWCSDGLLAYAVTGPAAARRRPRTVPARARARQPVVDLHPAFVPALRKLRAPIPDGRTIVFAVPTPLFRGVIDALVLESQMRPMKVDPRGAPILQLGAANATLAQLLAPMELGVVLTLLAPVFPAIATFAVEGLAGTSATLSAGATAVVNFFGRPAARRFVTALATLIVGIVTTQRSQAAAVEEVRKAVSNQAVIAPVDITRALKAGAQEPQMAQDFMIRGAPYKVIGRVSR